MAMLNLKRVEPEAKPASALLANFSWPKEPVDVLNALIEQGVYHRASDLHIEPQLDHYRVRFRIDGLLHFAANLSTALGSRLVARLKVLAALDTTDKQCPQDGRFHFNGADAEHARDCRLSTCPTFYGEKSVIRLLDPFKGALALTELGMSATVYQQLKSALDAPQGLILVTGPTGSGKTVTLYSALNYLNQSKTNIVTVEDPAEIALPGINQVSVNHKQGMDFARVLRAILRQDPDVIMLGEIRDAETAETAIQASQTGHLVLATLHANDCIDTLVRLHDLGVSMTHAACSLKLIMAQRLLRKRCEYCETHRSDPVNNSEANESGCAHCTNGYRGRTGVFECLTLTENEKAFLMANNLPSDFRHHFQAKITPSLRHAAYDQAEKGITTEQELNRVIA